MDPNHELAWKIYQALLEKGAGIGDAAVYIIEKVLDENNVIQVEEFIAVGFIPWEPDDWRSCKTLEDAKIEAEAMRRNIHAYSGAEVLAMPKKPKKPCDCDEK